MRLFLFGFLFLLFFLPAGAEDPLLQRFLAGDFAEVARICDETGIEKLDMETRCLYVESRARTSGGHEVLEHALAAVAAHPHDAGTRTAAGVVLHSLGDFAGAEIHLQKALDIDSRHCRALLAMALLETDRHRHGEARALLERVAGLPGPYVDSRFFHRVAMRIHESAGSYREICALLHRRAEKAAPGPTRSRLEARQELYRRMIDKTAFEVQSTCDTVELPMVKWGESEYRCLVYRDKGKPYYILLDSGNAPGWTLHEPELQKTLVSHRGSEATVATGSVDKELTSYAMMTDKLDFGAFSLHHLTGHYFKKPRDQYFDGNLNPYFIRNRVVSMDFINNRLILRTREAFSRYLNKRTGGRISVLPVAGSTWPFVPVTVQGYARAMAMIETGAEDLSIKLEFAQRIRLPLTSGTKQWQGREYPCHRTGGLLVDLGGHVFFRENTEAWPVRFHDNLTGLYDAVMIGPWALTDRFILTFDPFEKRVVLERSQ